jgi:hypothetical protein
MLPIEIDHVTYYTAAEAARYLSIARGTFAQNVRPKLQAYTFATLKRTYYRKLDLEQFLRVPRPMEESEGQP